MTPHPSGRVVSGLFLLAVLASGEALGSFECLPGPVPGGLADWAGRTAFSPERLSGWTGSLALGRPASVADLGWSHALVRRQGRRGGAAAEGFCLLLDDLYRESVLGLWVTRGGLTLGVRRWQVDWAGAMQRSGLTLCGQALLGRRRIEVRLMVQDLRIGRRDPAAPELRLGAAAGCHLHAGLAIEGGLFRSQGASGFQGSLLWSPVSSVTIHQVVRLPEQMLRTGVEFDAGRAVPAVWVEPAPRLGLRIGLGCSLRGRSGGRS